MLRTVSTWTSLPLLQLEIAGSYFQGSLFCCLVDLDLHHISLNTFHFQCAGLGIKWLEIIQAEVLKNRCWSQHKFGSIVRPNQSFDGLQVLFAYKLGLNLGLQRSISHRLLIIIHLLISLLYYKEFKVANLSNTHSSSSFSPQQLYEVSWTEREWLVEDYPVE